MKCPKQKHTAIVNVKKKRKLHLPSIDFKPAVRSFCLPPLAVSVITIHVYPSSER